MPLNWGNISEEEFIRLFPSVTNEELAALSGLTRRTIAGRAQARGLRKSAEHLAAVRWALEERHRGSTRSEETRRRLSESHTGYKMPEEQRLNIKKALRVSARRGPAHPCWKGGVRKHRAVDEPLYQDWRNAVLKRDAYTCQHCGYVASSHSKSRWITAHHKLPWADYPEERYNVDNGLTLCWPCHQKLHGLEPKQHQLAMKLCECGCGSLIRAFDDQRRPKHYVRNHSPKQRAALSAGATRRVLTEEERAKISQSKRGQPRSPEAIAKSAAYHRGRPKSPEHRAKIAESHRGLHHTQESREKMSASRQGKTLPREQVEKAAASNRGRKRSPEACARIAEGIRRAREKRDHTSCPSPIATTT